jgi:hypothetical protein
VQDSLDLAFYIKARRGSAGSQLTKSRIHQTLETSPLSEITTTQSIGCPIVTPIIKIGQARIRVYLIDGSKPG